MQKKNILNLYDLFFRTFDYIRGIVSSMTNIAFAKLTKPIFVSFHRIISARCKLSRLTARNKVPLLYSGKMEELNKDLGPGLMLDNTVNSAVENNHVGHEPEPVFSDDDEDIPLR